MDMNSIWASRSFSFKFFSLPTKPEQEEKNLQSAEIGFIVNHSRVNQLIFFVQFREPKVSKNAGATQKSNFDCCNLKVASIDDH